MTIELDTTLAQAEVLFLSFAQLLADIDRRQAEDKATKSGLHRRGSTTPRAAEATTSTPIISDNLRELLKAGR
jgi:TBC1 domain family member 15